LPIQSVLGFSLGFSKVVFAPTEALSSFKELLSIFEGFKIDQRISSSFDLNTGLL
jgi:hypothetical protein